MMVHAGGQLAALQAKIERCRKLAAERSDQIDANIAYEEQRKAAYEVHQMRRHEMRELDREAKRAARWTPHPLGMTAPQSRISAAAFRLCYRLKRPVSAAEVGRAVGCHPQTVRRNLGSLPEFWGREGRAWCPLFCRERRD